jgi:arsenite-transporting ATPase
MDLVLRANTGLQVVQFLKSDKYSHFQRIVFDTAPTGHTLRLLSLPDFLDLTIGKLVSSCRRNAWMSG